MAFHTFFKLIIDLKIHHKTGHFVQEMGSHVSKGKATYCCQEFSCEVLFRESLQLQ